MLATLDPELQPEWELSIASRADAPITAGFFNSWNKDAEPLSYCRQLNH